MLLLPAMLLMGMGTVHAGLKDDGRRFKWGEQARGSVNGFPIIYEEDFEAYPGSVSSSRMTGYLPPELFPQTVVQVSGSGKPATWTLHNGGYSVSGIGSPSAAWQGNSNLAFYVQANGAAQRIDFPGVSLAATQSPWLEFRYASAKISGVNELKVYWGVKDEKSNRVVKCGTEPLLYLKDASTDWSLQLIDLDKIDGKFGTTPDNKKQSLQDIVRGKDGRKVYFMFEGIAKVGAGACIDQVRLVDRQLSSMTLQQQVTTAFVKEPVGKGTKRNPAVLLGVDTKPGRGRVEFENLQVEVSEGKELVEKLRVYATRSSDMVDAVADPNQFVCELDYNEGTGRVSGVREWNDDWKPFKVTDPHKIPKRSLKPGSNYFWVVADIKSTATLKKKISFRIPGNGMQFREFTSDADKSGKEVKLPNYLQEGGENKLQVYEVINTYGFEKEDSWENLNKDGNNGYTRWNVGMLSPEEIKKYVSTLSATQAAELPEDMYVFEELNPYSGEKLLGTALKGRAPVGSYTAQGDVLYPHIYKAAEGNKTTAEQAKGRVYMKDAVNLKHFIDARLKCVINANVDGFSDFALDYAEKSGGQPGANDWISVDKAGTWRNASSRGWSRQIYDISSFADRRENMYFGFELVWRSAQNQTRSGVYLDDLQILAFPLERDVDIESVKVDTKDFKYGQKAEVEVVFHNRGSKTIVPEVEFEFFANGQKVSGWERKSVSRSGSGSGLANIASNEKVTVVFKKVIPDAKLDQDNLMNLEVRAQIKNPAANEDDDYPRNNSYRVVFYNFPTIEVSHAKPYPAYDEEKSSVRYERLQSPMQQWFPSATEVGKRHSWRQETVSSLLEKPAVFRKPTHGFSVWTTGRKEHGIGEESVLTGPVLKVNTDDVMELVLDYAMSGGEMWVEYSDGTYTGDKQNWKRVDASWTGSSGSIGHGAKLWYSKEGLGNSWAFYYTKGYSLKGGGNKEIVKGLPGKVEPEYLLGNDGKPYPGTPPASPDKYDGKFQPYNYDKYLQSKFVLPKMGTKSLQFRIHFHARSTARTIWKNADGTGKILGIEQIPQWGVAINQIQLRAVRPDFRIVAMGPKMDCNISDDIVKDAKMTIQVQNASKASSASAVTALVKLKISKLIGWDDTKREYKKGEVRGASAEVTIPSGLTSGGKTPEVDATGALNLGLSLPWQSMTSWGYEVEATLDVNGAQGFEGYGDEEEANNKFTWYYYPYRLDDGLLADWEPTSYPKKPREYEWRVKEQRDAKGSYDVSKLRFDVVNPNSTPGRITGRLSGGDVDATSVNLGTTVEYSYTLKGRAPKLTYNFADDYGYLGKKEYVNNADECLVRDKVTIKKATDDVRVKLVSPKFDKGENLLCKKDESFEFGFEGTIPTGAVLEIRVNGEQKHSIPIPSAGNVTQSLANDLVDGYNHVVAVVRTTGGNASYGRNKVELKNLYVRPGDLHLMPIFVRSATGIVSKVPGKRFDAGTKKWVDEPDITKVEKWGPVENYNPAENKTLVGLERPFMTYRWFFLENRYADWDKKETFPEEGKDAQKLPERELRTLGGQFKLVVYPGKCGDAVESKPIEVQNTDLQVVGFVGVRNGLLCHPGKRLPNSRQYDLDIPSGLVVEMVNHSPVPLLDGVEIRYSVFIGGNEVVADAKGTPVSLNKDVGVQANDRFLLKLPETIKVNAFSATQARQCKVVIKGLVYPGGRDVPDGNPANNIVDQMLKLEYPPEMEVLPAKDQPFYSAMRSGGQQSLITVKVAGGNSLRWEFSNDLGERWTRIDNGKTEFGPGDVPGSRTLITPDGLSADFRGAPFDAYRIHVTADGSGCHNMDSVYFNKTDIAVVEISSPSVVCGADAVDGNVTVVVGNLGYGPIPEDEKYKLEVFASATHPDPAADPSGIKKELEFSPGTKLYAKTMAQRENLSWSTVVTIQNFTELAELIRKHPNGVQLKAVVTKVEPSQHLCMKDIDSRNNTVQIKAAVIAAPGVYLQLNADALPAPPLTTPPTPPTTNEDLIKKLQPQPDDEDLDPKGIYGFDGDMLPVKVRVRGQTLSTGAEYTWEYIANNQSEDITEAFTQKGAVPGDVVILPVKGDKRVEQLSWQYENPGKTYLPGQTGRGSGQYRVRVNNRGCVGSASIEVKFNYTNLTMSYPEVAGIKSPTIDGKSVTPKKIGGQAKPEAMEADLKECALGMDKNGKVPLGIKMINTGNKSLQTAKDRTYTVKYSLKVGQYDYAAAEKAIADGDWTTKGELHAWHGGPKKAKLHEVVKAEIQKWEAASSGVLPGTSPVYPSEIVLLPVMEPDFSFLAKYGNANDLDVELTVDVQFEGDANKSDNYFTFKMKDLADANLSEGINVYAVNDATGSFANQNQWVGPSSGQYAAVYKKKDGVETIPAYVHLDGVQVGIAFNNQVNINGIPLGLETLTPSTTDHDRWDLSGVEKPAPIVGVGSPSALIASRFSSVGATGKANFPQGVFKGYGRVGFVGKTKHGCQDVAYMDLLGTQPDFALLLSGAPVPGSPDKCEGALEDFTFQLAVQNAGVGPYEHKAGVDDWFGLAYKVEKQGGAAKEGKTELKRIKDLNSGTELGGGKQFKLDDLQLSKDLFSEPGDYKVTVALVVMHGPNADQEGPSDSQIDKSKANNQKSFTFTVKPQPKLVKPLDPLTFYSQKKELVVEKNLFEGGIGKYDEFQWYRPSESDDVKDWEKMLTVATADNVATQEEFSSAGTYHFIFRDKETKCSSAPQSQVVEFKPYVDLEPNSIKGLRSKCGQEPTQDLTFSLRNSTSVDLPAGSVTLRFSLETDGGIEVPGSVSELAVEYDEIKAGESVELSKSGVVKGLNTSEGASYIAVVKIVNDAAKTYLTLRNLQDDRKPLRSDPVENIRGLQKADLKTQVINAINAAVGKDFKGQLGEAAFRVLPTDFIFELDGNGCINSDGLKYISDEKLKYEWLLSGEDADGKPGSNSKMEVNPAAMGSKLRDGLLRYKVRTIYTEEDSGCPPVESDEVALRYWVDYGIALDFAMFDGDSKCIERGAGSGEIAYLVSVKALKASIPTDPAAVKVPIPAGTKLEFKYGYTGNENLTYQHTLEEPLEEGESVVVKLGDHNIQGRTVLSFKAEGSFEQPLGPEPPSGLAIPPVQIPKVEMVDRELLFKPDFRLKVSPADFDTKSKKWRVKKTSEDTEATIIASYFRGSKPASGPQFTWESSYGADFDSKYQDATEALVQESGSAKLIMLDENTCKQTKEAVVVFLRPFSVDWKGIENEQGVGKGSVEAKSSIVGNPIALNDPVFHDGDVEFTVRAEAGSYISEVTVIDGRGLNNSPTIPDDKQTMTFSVDVTNGGSLSVTFTKNENAGPGSGEDEEPQEDEETPVVRGALSAAAVVSPFSNELVVLHADGCRAYEIYTEMGQRIMRRTHDGRSSIRVQMGDAPQGVYFVRLYAVDGSLWVLKALKL